MVTGGGGTWDFVTSYHLSGNGEETPLTPLNQGRYAHACGVYQDASDQQVRMMNMTFLSLSRQMLFQVLLVTGGGYYSDSKLSSTEVSLSSNDALFW